MSSVKSLKRSVRTLPAETPAKLCRRVGMASAHYDIALLVFACAVRLFSFGWLALVLMDYLEAIGFSTTMTGTLFTATLIGDMLVSLILTTTADTFGRRKAMIVSAILKIMAGVVYATSERFWVLMIAGVIGVISPSGSEVGPFMAIEQSALTETMHNQSSLAWLFSIYNIIGFAALASGGFASGWFIQVVSQQYSMLFAYRLVVAGYGMFGVIILITYSFLSNRVEPLHPKAPLPFRDWFGKFGLRRASSRAVIFKLSCLFTLDAFGAGFVLQTIIVYWFNARWNMDPVSLGSMISLCNVFSGLSAIVANFAVARYGAIKTMVFSHLPSNILLLLVPFMPTKTSAIICLLARFTLSQMDVPSRQLYVAMVVDPDERSSAVGITSLVRNIGISASPLLAGYMLQDSKNLFFFSMPFVVGGSLKVLYDMLLYQSFRMHRSDIGKTVLPTGGQGSSSAEPAETGPASVTEVHPLLSKQSS